MSESEYDLLTTGEAADRVRLAKSTMDKKRGKEGGPPFIKMGRCVRYRPADLDLWKASCIRRGTWEYKRQPADPADGVEPDGQPR